MIGIIFALLAIFLQGLVIGAAGFLIGGYILTVLATMIGLDFAGATTWIVYMIGGVIGVILISLLFDWALITLSSLAGASLILQSFLPENAAGGILFFIVFLLGVLIQGSMLRPDRATASEVHIP